MQDSPQSQHRPSFVSRHWGKLWLAQAVLLLGAGFAVAWSLNTPPKTEAPASPDHGDHAATELWTCSMHPQIRSNEPGKCPICGMSLVQVDSTAGGGMRTITVSPAARKLMQIETTPVERRSVTAKVRMVGKVEYDETRLSHITAWVSGRLDRLYVDYTGIEVKQGDHLVYIYSEELYSTQSELIQSLKSRREGTPATTTRLIEPIDLVASAREKLRLLGLTAEQIKEIEQRGTPADHVTIYSPIGGIVIEKLRQEGDRVRTGDRIYTVADLTQVWIKLDAYESDLQWLRYGQEVEFTTQAYPGETFRGQIAFIDPVLNKDTRTVKIRVNVPNKDGRLKPEMFVRAVVRSRVAAGGKVLDPSLVGKWISPMHPEIVKDEPGKCDICGMPLVRAESLGYATLDPDGAATPLVIPVSAALVTGKRAIVYVDVPESEKPTFDGREIVLGPRAGDFYLVRHGLQEGELVVTHGNFKLDSALQISAKPSMMTPAGGGGGGHDHGGHGGESRPAESEPSPHKLALPSQFNSQLAEVAAAYDNVTAAVAAGELERIRAAFDELSQTLARVDEKLLIGRPEIMWGELSMLLENDAVEGKNVATVQDADRVHVSLERHMQRLQDQFGPIQAEAELLARLDVPPEFKRQLGRLWQAYQPIGRALAADSFSEAQQAIARLPEALASIDAADFPDSVASAWRKERGNLASIASELGGAADIQSARAAFALLSEEMSALVKTFGVADAGPVYELHCPMAFRGRGASWLQNNDQARNPYFGATMLECVDRVELLAGAAERKQ